ncbi:probable E3 ubiquitin-protein ligase makorin-1 [Lingula anatina]|uniref:RING-type E3 ubiquitin transferase n=1 Tax=Lingula anatina TaxID=7574 RepID=A0A1S3J4I1_LINAN|nr:probable E3 ubiquitin-protein ligase makorin-1 [Lingula anatina]|eukprot:XP_013404749.1 probable E3 ubiquitin-protein ligase makorin-1 [Lingula anatina]
MAEAASPRGQVLCRYYTSGVCRQGEHCMFSHDRDNRPSNICRYYLKGHCTYGNHCRYDHTRPKEVSAKHIAQNPAPKPVPLLKADSQCASHKMVTLKKKTGSADSGIETDLTSVTLDPEKWVKAAEFVPGQPYAGAAALSYSSATRSGLPDADMSIPTSPLPHVDPEVAQTLLCPFAMKGYCRYEEACPYLHGEMCDLCGEAMIHPFDEKMQEEHRQQCIKQHEEDMELSFAVARSQDKVCGICMETVLEKMPPSERRFGILSNCIHVFCLSCIRKWRSAKQFENKIIRACPECRVKSDFVTPSQHWVESKEDKERLIAGYKNALGEKHCKYFKRGKGECPFNEKCFYLHAYLDGTIAKPQPRQRRRRQNADGDLDTFQRILLHDFFEERERMIELELQDALDHLLFHVDWLSDMSDSSEDYSDDETLFIS